MRQLRVGFHLYYIALYEKFVNLCIFVHQSLITFMESKLNVYGSGKLCHLLIEGIVDLLNPSLFQSLSVHEMIWGYTDPVLKFIYDGHHLPFVRNCPIPQDLTPFVQLQVLSILLVWY